MEKAFVAQRVANKLFATEEAVDAAMVEATELMTEMLKARKDVGVSTVFGDEAAAKLVEAIKALGEARTAMVGVHNELNEAKLRLGIRTKLAGPDKPYQRHIAEPVTAKVSRAG
jgi:ABC-type sugar transport system substrate-binding protein